MPLPQSTWIMPAYRAVYAALQADTAVAQFMAGGHWYLYVDKQKHPIEITAGDTPALICSPATSRMTIAPATNVSFDVRLPLEFDLRVKHEDVCEAVAFWEAVTRCLWARWISQNDPAVLAGQFWKYGTDPSVGLYKVEPGGPAISDLYDKAGEERMVRVSWKVTFPWTLVFRRNLGST